VIRMTRDTTPAASSQNTALWLTRTRTGRQHDGLNQAATTCLGTETPDSFAVPAPHDAHATPSITVTPSATRNPEGSIEQACHRLTRIIPGRRLQGQDVDTVRGCRIPPAAFRRRSPATILMAKCPFGHEHVDVNDCYWRALWEPGTRATGPEPTREPEDEADED
jgi:hypothetical protein